MNWYLLVLKKYAVFEGRASRKEYWFFVLFNIIFGIVASILDRILGLSTFVSFVYGPGIGLVYSLYALAVLIPSIAVSVRRLHDIGKSGWMLLVGLIPIIGFIWLLFLMVTESNTGSNEYGPSPLTAPA